MTSTDTTIVERLRSYASSADCPEPELQLEAAEAIEKANDEIYEAMSEIERLTSEIERLRQMFYALVRG